MRSCSITSLRVANPVERLAAVEAELKVSEAY
jgi:hypothetical protein